MTGTPPCSPMSRQTLHLLAVGVYHDQDRDHTSLWVKSIGRLMLARSLIMGAHQAALDTARRYPALLALRAAGIASLVAGRDDILFRLLTEPVWRDPMTRESLPAVESRFVTIQLPMRMS